LEESFFLLTFQPLKSRDQQRYRIAPKRRSFRGIWSLMAANCIIVASPPSAQPGGTWSDPSDTDMDALPPVRKPQSRPREHNEHSDDDLFTTPSRPARTATNKRARFERTTATPTASVPPPLPLPPPGTQTAILGTQKPTKETVPPQGAHSSAPGTPQETETQ
jgi:hypothetical protein